MAEFNAAIISNRAKATIFIIFALLLTGFGIEESLNDSERAVLMEMTPKISDMATSPIAQQMMEDDDQDEVVQPTAAVEESQKAVPPRERSTIPTNAVEEQVAEQITNVSTGVLDNYENAIVIPKIGAALPIIVSDSFDVNVLHSDLDSGVVLFPSSARFGQPGQTVLLGHSAPDNWPNIKHDTAFSRIDELVAGDTIVVYYEDKVFAYRVTRSEIIAKGGDLSGSPPAGNSLVLVSCWPPGRDLKRIAVESVLVSNE